MRTSTEIDDDLLALATEASGQRTTRATVEEALRRIVSTYHRDNALKDMVGIPWIGDLEAMRSGDPHLDRSLACFCNDPEVQKEPVRPVAATRRPPSLSRRRAGLLPS
jgi:Arc/MetJ family transcription regulator